MPRSLPEIINHVRLVCGEPSISTVLIQTEDMLALCDAAELSAKGDAEAMREAAAKWHDEQAQKTISHTKAAQHQFYAAAIRNLPLPPANPDQTK